MAKRKNPLGDGVKNAAQSQDTAHRLNKPYLAERNRRAPK